ncbi:DUF397 domain-containing protein [Saccharopolyspora sp. NFXS83]|uniref:DUF397 domain-containing protein n=1 Tax=Saccharopolyspora sp. NFXS83 TaxID=2993560 RepID=UPI00224AABC4|nr:DUF397 domain-containing protein [Saccharopolyspora sp. NFXS83]MCX2729906.1 DUF397 domain-containing protein [Saccharopolyspora sp. NFXS83]
MRVDPLTNAEWRKSSFSGGGNGGGGQCVEAAALPDGRVAVRNSKRPEDGAVLFTRAEMLAWVQGVKAGEFDDLT